MRENDLWIAATAAASDAILVTTDKDFDHLHENGHLRRIWVNPATRSKA
jgi:tRNA(fMet)-specific endonuclease VapC